MIYKKPLMENTKIKIERGNKMIKSMEKYGQVLDGLTYAIKTAKKASNTVDKIEDAVQFQKLSENLSEALEIVKKNCHDFYQAEQAVRRFKPLRVNGV